MKIIQVQTIPIDRARHGVLGYLVLVHTDAGLTGLGEVAADCHPTTVAHAIRQLQLVGRDPLRIEEFGRHSTRAVSGAAVPSGPAPSAASSRPLGTSKEKT